MKKWKVFNIIVPIMLAILWLIFAPIPIKVPIEDTESSLYAVVLLFLFIWNSANVLFLISDSMLNNIDWRWWKNKNSKT